MSHDYLQRGVQAEHRRLREDLAARLPQPAGVSGAADPIGLIREIVMERELISVVEHGVCGSSPDTYSGVTIQEALEDAARALREIRHVLGERCRRGGCEQCRQDLDPTSPAPPTASEWAEMDPDRCAADQEEVGGP